MRRSLEDPEARPPARLVDTLCPHPDDCNARRWYGTGALPTPGCWECASFSVRYLIRPTQPWVGAVVERSLDKQPWHYLNRWVG